MTDTELLNEYASLSMQLQEAYLQKVQDFTRQKELNAGWAAVRNEILQRMAERG